MPSFGIYYFQFKHDNGLIKKYNSTVIGEVCLESDRYFNMSVKQACLYRIKQELSLRKNIPIEDLSHDIVNFGCYKIITVIKKRGVDNLVRNMIDITYNLHELSNENFTKTQVIDLGNNNCEEILDKAVSKLLGYNIKYGRKKW